MRHWVTAVLLFFSTTMWAQGGYQITVTLKPFKNQYIYLGYYNGKQLPIIDSVRLNATSQAVFKGPKKLGGGIYLVGYPDRSNKFEFLLGKQQTFSIVADTANIANISFIGSPENNSFKAYQQFMTTSGKAIDALAKKQKGAPVKDSAALGRQIDSLSKKVAAYRVGIISQQPDGLLATLLKGMREPEVPTNPAAAKADSLYAYHYFKNHYWNGVNFWDDRISRTPFFEARLDKYFDQLVYPAADSVIHEMDWMLSYAQASDEMQKFLLLKFVNRYLNQKYMWEDAVFVHLFEKFFSQKNYSWLTDKGRKIITDRAYSLMSNITGTAAAEIDLPDTSGKKISLYGVESAYTVLAIYDPTCSHCKETLPKLDSLYQAKWKSQGVKMFGMAKETDGKRSDWLAFIHQYGIGSWVNVYYSKEMEQARVAANTPSYSQLYDVQSFPTLYLLDKEKHIIAKKLTYTQIDEILDQRIKTAKSQ